MEEELWVAKDRPRLINFDFAAPPPLPENQNIITLHAVLEHVVDPVSVVQSAHEILEPGGYLLLTPTSDAAKPVLEFLAFKLKLISRQEDRPITNSISTRDSLSLFKGTVWSILRGRAPVFPIWTEQSSGCQESHR